MVIFYSYVNVYQRVEQFSNENKRWIWINHFNKYISINRTIDIDIPRWQHRWKCLPHIKETTQNRRPTPSTARCRLRREMLRRVETCPIRSMSDAVPWASWTVSSNFLQGIAGNREKTSGCPSHLLAFFSSHFRFSPKFFSRIVGFFFVGFFRLWKWHLWELGTEQYQAVSAAFFDDTCKIL